jgi:glycosyltransferase involved in cell wall biosynthesis
MELTKKQPIKLDIIPISEGVVTCELKIKASKKTIKINVDILLCCQNPTCGHMTDMITSGVQSLHTSKNDETHSLKFHIPKFIETDRKQSNVIISLGLGEDPYAKVYIEDIKVDANPPMTITELSQQKQQPVEQKIQRQPVPRQSLADQLFASTITPNARPKTFTSAPINQLIQCTVQQNKNKDNNQIQDVRPRQEIQLRQNEISQLLSKNQNVAKQKLIDNTDKIIFMSTFGIKCGIATYTMHLMSELNNLSKDSFTIEPTNEGSLNRKISGKLVHIQHEFGIIPKIPMTDSKVIITWHTVPSSIGNTINKFESELNVVAYIVHCKGALDYIHTKKDIYVVNHGSASIKDIKKEDARKILNINGIYKPIGFVFGFQGSNKLYGEIIHAAENTNIHIIISGSPHESGHRTNLPACKNVTFLNRYITEEEIDLYALASDLLLFDYTIQDHYSCSGAAHRIICSGRPMICPDTKHFSDFTDKVNVLKFHNIKELMQCIEVALTDSERLGKAAREYAEMTSWDNIAKRHIEIYGKYINL